MESDTPEIQIIFRIPGAWAGPKELIERLPEGYRLTPEALMLPDGSKVEFGAVPADDEFAGIFRSSCRNEPTEEEMATLDGYSVNVLLSGPGGSIQAAHRMMQAAAAFVQAGGAGVFIDNSALAHGGQNWLAMTDNGSADALSFAYVSIVSGKTDVWTMGMHTLGLHDLIMKHVDAKSDFGIIEVMRYMAESDKPVGDGHLLCDQTGPRFRAVNQSSDEKLAGGPMHNPFGRLRLVSMREVAESN